MGWNGSDPKKVSTESRCQKKNGKGVNVGLIVLLGGGLAAWLIFGRALTSDAPQSGAPVPSAQIADAQPAVVTNAPVAKTKPYAKKTNEEKLKELQDKYGDNPPPGIAQVMYFLKNPPKKGYAPKGSADYLRHSSERYIAGVALAQPGSRFFVKPRLDPRFDRDFAIALETPVEINKDDSEEIAESKRAVEAVKQEIARTSKETGKKPSEIIYEHAMAMYELGQYQLDLEQQIKKVRDNSDFSDADYLDFVRAANEMLKNKGIREMPLPNVTRRALRLERMRRAESLRKENKNK